MRTEPLKNSRSRVDTPELIGLPAHDGESYAGVGKAFEIDVPFGALLMGSSAMHWQIWHVDPADRQQDGVRLL